MPIIFETAAPHPIVIQPRRRNRKVWIFAGLGVIVLLAAGLLVGVSLLSRRIQPWVSDQITRYLERRFDSTVQLSSLKIDVPAISPARWIARRGRGVIIRVEGDGLVMRHHGRTDVPPMFTLRRFVFHIDMAALFELHHSVKNVQLDGFSIRIPPEGERPRLGNSNPENSTGVDEVIAHDVELVILPRDPSKVPLEFRIQYLHLEATGNQGAMKYEALLTNPKPPGQIQSTGTFGPWNAAEPGESALGGHYVFHHADLSVFHGIAGLLDSRGEFTGRLDSIHAQGTAIVNDFRLTSGGNPVPLRADYDATVDGANGDTILKPVQAVLGKTAFTTSGAVIRNDLNGRHAITLDVLMPHGRLEDIIRLGVKGPPMMQGEIFLKSKISLPPESGKVDERLDLDGEFRIARGEFLKTSIQDKIDELSRRAQGQPKNEEIDQVFANLSGKFRMDDQVVYLRDLSFMIPGAMMKLDGNYNLANDQIDFRGSLSLDAKVSQTMTGWKRIVLKPVDPFFSKNGAGTFLRIRVDGTSKDVHYGLDHSGKKK